MKTLISKLGALGDVVRSTALLSELDGDIYWLTSRAARPLLNSKRVNRYYVFENPKDLERIAGQEFDLVLSLDEEREPLEFLKGISTRRFIGHFLDAEGKVDYTHEAAYWLDMSMVSKRYSREEANRIKAKNTKPIPQILIEMIGKEWNGQEYDLGVDPLPKEETKGRVGLIDVTESKWPNKYWAGYPELKERLKDDEYNVISLGIRQTIEQHIEDINSCETIVCGDTLGMHIALGLRKNVVAIFNCTPPNEIYDYGRMRKIVSPLIDRYMFNRDDIPEAQSAINVDEVYEKVKEFKI